MPLALGLSACGKVAGGSMPCIQYYPALLVARTPYCSGVSSQGEIEYRVRFNGLGLRGPDFDARAPKGVKRVLFLGGSVAFGGALEEEESPVRLLGIELSRRLGAPVEVINGAGEGYLSWQNAARLDELLDAYSPDLVVYHLQGRTVFQELSWEKLVTTTVSGDPVRMRAIQDLLPGWARPLITFRIVPWLTMVFLEQWTRIQVDRALSGLSQPEITDTVLRPTLRILGSMKRKSGLAGARFVTVAGDLGIGNDTIIRKRGIRFVVANFFLDRFLSRIQIPGDQVEQAVKSSGFKVIRFDETIDPQMVNAGGDYHWDRETSRRFAEQAAERLVPVFAAMGTPGGK